MKIYGRGLWRRFLTSSAHYIRSSPVRLRPSWQLSQARSLSSHVGGSLSKPKMGSPPQSFQGQSGLVYSVERILQERPEISRYVYLAKAGNESFVLKTVSKDNYTYYQDIYERLRSCENLRVACDSVSDPPIFIYKYLDDHLLSFAQENPELPIIKRILKDALRGLAALHDQDIVHTGRPRDALPPITRIMTDACHRHQTKQHLHPTSGQ